MAEEFTQEDYKFVCFLLAKEIDELRSYLKDGNVNWCPEAVRSMKKELRLAYRLKRKIDPYGAIDEALRLSEK